MRIRNGLWLLVAMLFGTLAYAETAVEYGITGSYQNMSKNSGDVTSPVAASFDYAVDMDLGSGVMHVLFEGATGTSGRVGSLLAGSNYDVGTAVDGAGNGRLQVSELSYKLDFFAYDFSIGVQNISNFVDINSSANSETSQFMSSSLVNNPTITMPMYAPSLVFNYGYANRTNATFVVANAYGLVENRSKGYADIYKDLFDFGTAADGTKKGVFALAEVRMEDQDVWLSFGSWVNTREVDSLTGGYANLDYAVNPSFKWSTRYGWNSSKTAYNTFASISTAFSSGDDDYGLGLAWHGSALGANPLLIETYYRWQLTDTIAITPDVQLWWNSNSLASPTNTMVGGQVIAYGIRLQYGDAVTY